MHDNNIYILALQETDISGHDEKNPFKLSGFDTHVPITHGLKTRLLVFTRSGGFNRVIRCDDLMSDMFPSVWLEIHQGRKQFHFCGLYRKWKDHKGNTSIEAQVQAFNIFLKQLDKAREGNLLVVCMGDVNLDANRFEDPNYGLKDQIGKPTSQYSCKKLHVS